jgi:hypothetical protein
MTQILISSSESVSHFGLHFGSHFGLHFGLHCFGLHFLGLQHWLWFYSKTAEISLANSISSSCNYSVYTNGSILGAATYFWICSGSIFESDFAGSAGFFSSDWLSILTDLEISASPKSIKSTLRLVFIYTLFL